MQDSVRGTASRGSKKRIREFEVDNLSDMLSVSRVTWVERNLGAHFPSRRLRKDQGSHLESNYTFTIQS